MYLKALLLILVFIYERPAFSEEYPPPNPNFSPRSSAQQQLLEATIPPIAEIALTFPLIALKMDRQAKQATELSPSEVYRGIKPMFVSWLATTGVMIGGKNLVSGPYEDSSAFQEHLAGAVGGLVSGIASNPTELAVTQQRLHRESWMDVNRRIIKNNGASTLLLQGVSATGIRSMFTGMGLLGTLPILKEEFSNASSPLAIPATVLGTSIATSLVSYPFDVLRGEMHRQMRASGEPTISLKEAYKRVTRNDGPAGLYRGITYRVAQGILSFVILDTTIGFLRKRPSEQDALLTSHSHPATSRQVRPLFADTKIPELIRKSQFLLRPEALNEVESFGGF